MVIFDGFAGKAILHLKAIGREKPKNRD